MNRGEMPGKDANCYRWRIVLLLLPVLVLNSGPMAESRRPSDAKPPSVNQSATRAVNPDSLGHSLSLASADFDEDGVPDVIVSAGSGFHGHVILHRGNIDSIFPNSPAAFQRKAKGEFSDAPFLSPANVYPVPDLPEFVAAGDFNADGHQDIVIARKGAGDFYLLPGDGKGRFGRAQDFRVPADITFLISGEINRADGLADLLVAVSGRTSSLLVYEGLEGALRSKPEMLDMPGQVSGISLGQWDDRYPMDAAITSGNELLLLQGRDRQLYLPENQRKKTRVKLHRLKSPSPILSLQFPVEKSSTSISMNLNGDAQPDLVRLNSSGPDLQILPSGPASTFTVNVSWNDSDPWINGVCDVDNNSYNGLQCSLRAAIQEANATSAPDSITFSISGSLSIGVFNSLPAITYPVTIDGTSQPGIELYALYYAVDGLQIASTAPGSTIQGLTINGFPGYGIRVQSSGNIIRGNYIGTNTSGTAALPNNGGIYISNVSSNTIGGTAAGARNLISGNNGPGIYIFGPSSTGNVIQGNYFGLNAAGTDPIDNIADGIYIDMGRNNTIGGTTVGARNVISRSSSVGLSYGVNIPNSGAASGNLIQGNYIGTNAGGSSAMANKSGGIAVYNSGNTIGGTVAGAGNLISGNSGYGVAVNASGTTVAGNLIGTNASGVVAVPNSNAGVFAGFASSITVGGTTTAARNVISGNNGDGIQVLSGNAIVVRGNYVGTTSDGAGALANTGYGISLDGAFGNTIGGTGSGSGNLIAFNNKGGVNVLSGSGNSIRGNSIGSNDASGGSGLGIDLSPAGVTANDPGDGDGGANYLQNYPVLTAAYPSGNNTVVRGTLNSVPNSTYYLDFYSNSDCDPSGNGEGRNYLGSLSSATNGTGDMSFAATLPVVVSQGSRITATATDLSGNTSEFSTCIEVKPGITINDVTKVEGNSGSATAVFIVTLSAASAGDVSVDYATVDDAATAGFDYTGVSGTLTIASGDLTGTIEVPILGDTLDEIDETYFVNLSGASGAHIVDSQGLGTIDDDDNPTVSISDAEVLEGNAGTGDAVFNVILSASSPQEIRVAYSTSDITATAGVDYVARSGLVVFSPGSVLQTVSITVNGDAVDETHETFAVDLNNPVDGVIADGRGIGTIHDDDLPLITISDVALYEGDSGTVDAVFTVTLTTFSEPPLTSVDYATADDTAIAGEDYIAANGTLTIGAGLFSGTIVVQVKGDTNLEPARRFFVNLSNPVNGILADSQAIGTIHDDEMRMRQYTLNGGGGLSTSGTAEYALVGSLGQESVIGTSSSTGYVLQSGFWSYLGSGLVPVILSVARNAGHPDYLDLSWSGNNPPYGIYRTIDCSQVYADLLATESTRAYTDSSPPETNLVCYAIIATSPGP